MKIYHLKCPNCGATLATDVKNNRARCEYCGNEFIISGDTDAGGKEKPDENSSRKQQENDLSPEKTAGLSFGPVPDNVAGSGAKQKESHFKDILIILLFIVAGLTLSHFFDKETPQDIVPKTDLHRFFTELPLNSRPQDIEALARKHKLHYFRTEKAVNSSDPDRICYKVAKTNETVLDKQGAHAERVEAEFDAKNNDSLMWAVYSDPEHITGRAVLFKYGTYYSLSPDPGSPAKSEGYYYYNNSLRSTAGEQTSHPPYLKCGDATEALKKIYTYRK